MNLTCINLDMIQWTANCVTVIVAAIYIKIIYNVETLV